MNKKYVKCLILVFIVFIIGTKAVEAKQIINVKKDINNTLMIGNTDSFENFFEYKSFKKKSGKTTTENDTKIKQLSSICTDKNVKRVVKAGGLVLFISKIIVPILLIAMAVVGFIKAMMSGDDKAIKETAMKFVKNLIAAVIIFVLPTIVNVVLGLAEDSKYSTKDYVSCRVCFFETSKCK